MNGEPPHNHKQDPDKETFWDKLTAFLHLPGDTHDHGSSSSSDNQHELLSNELGIRTVKQALLLLGLTTLLQAVIYMFSGSVALLADTVHNLGDALNSIPLWVAFLLARRAATKRYTYGFGRAEDIAGLFIVLSIAFSAGYILYEAISKFIDPQPISYGGWVIAAALVGFAGNETVALLQIRVGRKIGSEAMITDGKHARVDGLTSLAVLPAVFGSWLNLPILDPVFGLLIGVGIIFITRDAVVAMWYRLMDAVDPALVEQAESAIRRNPDVQSITSLRMRWVGHRLHLEGKVRATQNIEFEQVNTLIDDLEQTLEEQIPNLKEITLSITPNS
ncbi:MAG TPA: cation diffusion facilitator family transporter [Anaerolineales bacterium]|nr:cation diffusion facilitator family transporter [Anaerolineales bacterium]